MKEFLHTQPFARILQYRMKHYNEQTLTQYVLKAKEIARQRKTITSHLAQCAQCLAIVEDLRAIYADASQQLETKQTQENVQPILLPAKRSTALQKRMEELMYESFRVPIPQRNAIQKVWYVAKRYPVVSGSVSFFALAFVAFFALQIVKNNFSPEKQSPVDFKIESNYSLALVNKFGEKVGAIDVNPKIVAQIQIEINNIGEVRSIKFYDVDKDGINEIFLSESSTINANGTANIRAYFLKHLDRNWVYKVTRQLTFPNNPEFIVPMYAIREILLEDFDKNGKPEIVMNVQHVGSFPSMVIKLDAATGKEIDWFYNPGGIQKIVSVDLNNDGIQEIIAIGTNNAYKLPFIAVFDPRYIRGKAPATVKYEPSDVSLGTMKNYILIPPTKVGKYFFERNHLFGGVMRVSLYHESKKIKTAVLDLSMDDKTFGYIEIIFDYNINPLGITTGTEYDAAALDLYKKKIISELPDKKYFQEYLKTLQHWNGKEFQTTPTINSNYIEAVGKKERLTHLP